MEEAWEKELDKAVRPYLAKGRPGDYEHTLRVVAYGKILLQHEEGEKDIVIPTLYLHDIGWSRVDFSDFTRTPLLDEKWDARSVELHMKYGAESAKCILQDLHYPEDAIQTIVSIVAIHDEPRIILNMENPSALLVFEADFLDKYGIESLQRFKKMFGEEYMENYPTESLKEIMRTGLKKFFRTRTAQSIARRLAIESGLFTDEELTDSL
jgi:uncharacterized protein